MNGLTIRRYGFIGFLVVVILGGVVLLAMSATSEGTDPREVRLIARDMTFFVANDETPNPTLRFRAGERVRLVLRNEDAGMQHDFVIKNWKVGSALLNGKGETVFEFQVPEERGSESYSCTPHPVMMRGAIEVE
jgi:plastocyanin